MYTIFAVKLKTLNDATFRLNKYVRSSVSNKAMKGFVCFKMFLSRHQQKKKPLKANYLNEIG